MGCQFPQPDVYFVALMKNLNKIRSSLRSPPLYKSYFIEIFKEKSGFIVNKSVVKLFHAVRMSFIWHVWNWRNKILHASSDNDVNAIRHENIFFRCKDCLFYESIIVHLRISSHGIIGLKNHSELASSSLP